MKPQLTSTELGTSLLAIIRSCNGIGFNSLRAITSVLVRRRTVAGALQRLRKAGLIKFAGAKVGWVATVVAQLGGDGTYAPPGEYLRIHFAAPDKTP
jgi:hypothetical protein